MNARVVAALLATPAADRPIMRVVRLVYLALGVVTASAQPAKIDSMDPSLGPIAGGTIVKLGGSGFTGAEVRLDRKIVAPLSQTAGEIRLQMPPHDNGYALVSVGSAYARFLYVPPRLSDLPAGSITTVAGIGLYVGEYGPANAASIRPWGLAFDATGTLYFADSEHNRVFRVRDGILEPYAGTGLNGQGVNAHSGDAALDTPVSFPRGIAFDSKGNLYLPDTSYHIWRVRPDGVAEIVAGKGREAFSGDGGPAIQADIGHPSHVAVDLEDNVYFIDWTNARIRKIDRNGIISTYAGRGTFGLSGDGGPATEAQFNLAFADLGGLATDRSGNLLLNDYDNQRIRRIDRLTGIIDTVIAPTPGGPRLNDMRSMAVSPTNEIFVANAAVIYRRRDDGTLVKVTSGSGGFDEDGAMISTARMGLIGGMAFDAAGNLFYSDISVRRVRMVDSSGRIKTIAGSGPQNLGEGGPATAAAMMTPYMSLDFLPTGELAIADYDRFRKIDGEGKLVRFAGAGLPAPLEDVPALSATMAPFSMHVSRDGTIDYAGGQIFRIDPDGVVRRTAGVFGPCVLGGDGGDARAANFCQPWDVVRDAHANVYIADTNNNRIRRVDARTGIIDTVAGSGAANGLERYGSGMTCGDGGSATNACINTPWGLVFDDVGNLYVSENADRIRRVDRSGIITTVAEVRVAKLTWAFGNLFSVSGDGVRRISPAGTVTRLTAGGIGFSGDGGPVSQAHIYANKLQGIAADDAGNLYFADSDNLRVRAIRYGALLAPPGATIQASANGSIRATVFDANGRRAAGVRVDFTPPTSGPSCTLATPFAITDANGEVSVYCASNCVPGSYVVTATPLTGTTSAGIGMTNAAGACVRRRAAPH